MSQRLNGRPSGALTARGPASARVPAAAVKAPLSARGTASDRGPGVLLHGAASGGATSSTARPRPSEVIAAARQPAGAAHAAQGKLSGYHSVEQTTPRILSFNNLSNFSNHADSVVSVDVPLFRPTPAEIRFSGFEGLQSFDATLSLRNQDNVARRVKILPPDSSFFEVLPGRGRKAGGSADNKVAPGMEISYIIRFKPDAQVEDYHYDLIVVTEREKFVVPIRARGGSALLEMPDSLEFGTAPVKYETDKTILVRNVGEKPTKFLLKVPPPFSTSIQDSYLEVGESMQVVVTFRPDKADKYNREMLVVYGDGVEALVALQGQAENVQVSFSDTQVNMLDTFIALSTQKTIIIYNNSEVPVDFSWRAFPSIEEEIGQKLKLQVQLRQEESAESQSLQLFQEDDDEDSDENSSILSSSSEEGPVTMMTTHEMKHGALQRRYRNIAKAILEDPMFFYDEIFAVEPLSGRIWAKSKQAITFTFTPKAALNYQCLAYCSVVGQADRLPLLLKGQGIGPKAAFSYDELDVGDIFVESVHQYEVNLINQGDIAVKFRLIENNSPFGSKFTFEPEEGELEVGGQCTINVEVCPDLLGEFQETFFWELVGSTSTIPLNFKGHSVSPTFHFDLDRISFGVISYGFLNSKTLMLTNTSEVPMRFCLRIPGDGRFAQREFDVIPPKGTLLPNCSQKVQVDFISVNVKSYDLCLVVDLDGVGQELASIPIQARCSVPQVTFEPQEMIEYGDIFIRYPSHQTLVLNNTSALPAKFQILAQEESTRALAEFEPDQSFGSVPPMSSHVITFTLTSQNIGPLQIPITVRVLGHNTPRTITLVANSIGPIVNVEPATVDWGNAKCLESVTKHVKVTNNSVINASVRCIMKTKNSLWTVSPKALELEPYESANLALTLTIDEVTRMTDLLHVVVHESNDVAVTVRGKGIGTPVTCKDSLDVIDFGTQYTTQTISKEFIIENRGRQARKLVWILESEEGGKKKDRKSPEIEKDPDQPKVYSVSPDTMILDGKNAFRFVFNAMSPKSGELSDVLLCQEYCGNDRKGNTIFRCELRGNFVVPLLDLSSPTVSFRYLWDRDTPIHPLCEQLTLTCVSPLDIRFFIKVQPPFYVNIDTGFLRHGEKIDIRVEFDPAFKVDRVCGTVKQKLTIVYQDHPQKDHVNLIGEVVFPNLSLSTHKLDFGSVLNETTKQLSIVLSNPNPLPVNFQWAFVEEQEYNESDLVDPSPEVGSIRAGSIAPGSGPNSAQNTATSGFFKHNTPSMSVQSDQPQALGATGDAMTMALSPGPARTSTGGSKIAAVDINQIFDILPIMGTLEPGGTQVITFTYFGLQNNKFDAAAVCQTEGGPEYEIALKGQASRLEFKLDKTELTFGEVPYNEVLERDIILSNTGKVAYYYSWNLSGLSRPTVLDCSPLAGQINPGDKEKISIRFRAGIPDLVEEEALLEVAHFEPQAIQVRGHGIFPGVLLDLQGTDYSLSPLPRQDEAEHAKLRKLAFERLLQSGPPPPGACVLETDEEVDNWQPCAQLVEFEVDRHFICESLLQNEAEAIRVRKQQEAMKKALAATELDGQGDVSSKKAKDSSKGQMSKSSRGLVKEMADQPAITAAHYTCDFGHIVLGHSGKKVISVQNCFSEPVSFIINRKALLTKGFTISPERAKKLPVGKSIKLELTSFRAKDAPEGKQDLDWIIPIRNGPNYEVRLTSEFVRPDLELSSEHVDFGRVIVGQVKRITIKLRNSKPVQASWSYKPPRDKLGKLLSPQETIYSLSPSSGTIQPGQMQLVVISFTPNNSRNFNQKLALRILDNPTRKLLALQGAGDALRVQIEPETSFQLGPILPHQDTTQELFLYNPTDYPIEVYSVDFDSRYKEEEYCLRVYNQYDQYELMELPVRSTGEQTWTAVARYGESVRRLEEYNKQKAEKEQQKRNREQRLRRAMARKDAAMKVVEEIAASEEAAEAQGADPADSAADPGKQEAKEKAQADLEAAEAELLEAKTESEEAAAAEAEEVEEPPPELDEGDIEEEGVPQMEMDPANFGYRVPDEDRLHVLLMGPPSSGKSSLAKHLAENGGRKVLSLEEVMTWALSAPLSLQGEADQERRDRLLEMISKRDEDYEKEEADRQKQATKAKVEYVPLTKTYAVPTDDLAHYVRARLRLPDCNACVVFDGLATQYVSSMQDAAEALFKAVLPEKLLVLGISFSSSYGLGASEALPLGFGQLPPSLAALASAEEADTPDAEAKVEQRGVHATALQRYYDALKQALEARLRALQETQQATETAAQEAEEAAEELRQQAEKARQAAEEAAATAASLEGDPASEGQEQGAPPAQPEAALPTETAEQAVEEGPTLAEMEAKAAELHNQVAKFKSEHATCSKALEQLEARANAAEKNGAQDGGAATVVEGICNDLAALEAAAALALGKADAPGETSADGVAEGVGAGAAQQEGQGQTEGEAEKTMKFAPPDRHEQETPPITFLPLGLGTSFAAGTDPEGDFAKLKASAGQQVPAPLVPKEAPLPPPSFAQIVARPQKRQARPAVDRFMLMTPDEQTGEEEAGAAAAGTAASPVPDEGNEDDEKVQPTRWIIEPGGRQRLLLKFAAQEIGTFTANLGFEVVGGHQNNAHVALAANGIATYPGISNDPRNVFMRRAKNKPASGYANKQFITSLGVFDFGPLLAGRDPEARKPAEDGTEEGRAPGQLDQWVRQHVEQFRITNNSLFKAEVDFKLASMAARPVEESAKGGKPKKGEAEPNPLEEYPFIVEPEVLELDIGETKELSVSCFPVKEGTYSDTIVATIKDNPDPVEFPICAIGALPKINLDPLEVDFDRLLLNQRAVQTLKLANVCAVPVKWRLEPADKDGIPEVFNIDPLEGTLAVAEERNITVVFRSEAPGAHKFGINLQIADTEGMRGLENTQLIEVKGEAFSVDVTPKFPDDLPGLDFGQVRVGFGIDKFFHVTNNGKYPVKFELKVKRKIIRGLLDIVYGEGPAEPADPKAKKPSAESVSAVTIGEDGLPELQPGQKAGVKVTLHPVAALQCPEPRRFARTGKNEELELMVYEAKTGEQVQLNTPPIPLTFAAVFNSFNITPPRGLNFGPVKIGETCTREFEICNDGPFEFDWYLFDPSASHLPSKPEGGQLQVDQFKITPAEGTLAPHASVKISAVFNAVEDKYCDYKIGMHVDGLPDLPNTARPGTRSVEAETTAQNFFGGGGGGGNPVREYILTAHGCTPGIDSENVQAIFEEQFVAPSLEDAIATAGRIDIRAFDEGERYFSFGPVLVRGPNSSSASDANEDAAKFRITNPNPIPCDVKMDIKPKVAQGGKDASMVPFELSTKDLHIPAHEYRYVKVKFSPTALQTYSAIFEALVPEGKDPKTNQLQFEIRGDGNVPSISISGPPVFGDLGGQFDFGRLRVGRSHSVEFTLRNEGKIPATGRCELSGGPDFTTTCPRTIPLEPKASFKFQVNFHPQGEGDLSTTLRLHTLHNSFEDSRISFKGKGYVEHVSWDIPPPASASLESASLATAPDPDLVDLGDVGVGAETTLSFQICNSAKAPIRFEFPETLPAPFTDSLKISPSVGHVSAGQRKNISFTFRPTETMKGDVSLPVNMASIAYTGEAEEWDDSMRAVDFDSEEVPPDAADDAKPQEQVLPEPEHRIIDGTARELSLRVLALADTCSYECSVERIAFSPTVLFQARIYRFTVKNPSSISLPYNWRVVPAEGKEESPGMRAFSITPAEGGISAGASQEFQVRFAPMDVESFACMLDSQMPSLASDAKPPLHVALDGKALRPWCHFELPSSDYRSRRQSDTPLDPKYQVIEVESLGTRIKNTKRFYVLNPTSDTYDFTWKQDETDQTAQTEDPFRCVTKRGTILPGKKFEMVFEYLPATVEPFESLWTFSIIGREAFQSFVLVGTVKEPRIGLDVPCVMFNRLLLGASARETVHIVNKEHIPFSFSLNRASFDTDGAVPAISLSPMRGVVGPGASLPIEVTFVPREEKFFNFNVVCDIKRKEQPLLLNIKGEGYKIHTKLVLEEAEREGRELHAGVRELLDFGEMQVQERRSFTLKLSSPSFDQKASLAGTTEDQPSVSYDFMWQLRTAGGHLVAPRSDAPPYLTISPIQGTASQENETQITIEYAPNDSHTLDGASLRMLIPSGPEDSSYTLVLNGRATRPSLDFSTASYDFGPCFVKRAAASAGEPTSPSHGNTPFEKLDLVVTNRGAVDCWLSTTYQRNAYLDVQLPASMVEAGQSLVVPIIFTPREAVEYRERVEFVINDATRTFVNIRGRGCPLLLEPVSLAMQNVDFGVAVGNNAVQQQMKVVNRSQRPVEFVLHDPDGQLGDKCVSWAPSLPLTLRPKEQTTLELRYSPTFPMPPFKLPLVAKCNFGQEVHIGSVSGTCHTAEVRLSEHSILFGDVVFQSTSVRKVHLHNFGDLGVKFRFDMPQKSGQSFSVEPSEGFVAPRDDVLLQVKFHPVKHGSADARPKRIKCLLEPNYQQEPLELIVQGQGIEQREGSEKLLQFSSVVRDRQTLEFTFPPDGKNPSSEPWKLVPVVTTEVPTGEPCFSCPEQIVVPPGGQTTVQVTYRPLSMTRAEGAAADGEEGTGKGRKKEAPPEKHLGKVFIATPDGNAFTWNLEGVSLPPGEPKKLSAEVQCKKPHIQSIPVSNWLQQNQRFKVDISLTEPVAANEEIKLNGVGQFDVPGSQQKEYKFNVYAYREGTAKAQVRFTNPKTEEFIVYEVSFKFVAPSCIDTLQFSTTCRQTASKVISVLNPLSSVANFKCQASTPDIRFSTPEFVVPPNSEATLEVLFRPIAAGSGEAKLSLISPELGDYPYMVQYTAKAAGLDKTIVFKAPLGSTDCVQIFRFMHYAQEATTYTASIEAAPGHKSPTGDFSTESKDVKAEAGGKDGVEVSVNVRFQPSELGEIRALLVLSSANSGEYKALLIGYTQPPQPQGPFAIATGKGASVDFQNPFTEPVEFTVQIDNPDFVVQMRSFKLDAKKTQPLAVTFTGNKQQGGRLMVSAARISTPWVFFLQGTP